MDNLYFSDAEYPENYTITVMDLGRFLNIMVEYSDAQSQVLNVKLDVADAEVLGEYLYKWVEKQLEIF